MRILLVEDDAGLGGAIRDQLAAEGHAADLVASVEDALASVETASFDLVLLDLTLPDGSGIDFLRRLRARGLGMPVIILTARDRITERIEGLNAGADDYMVKPFDLSELSARIGAVARRYAGNPNPRLMIGPLEVDVAGRSIEGPDGPVVLSHREWAILDALLHRPNSIVSKAQLEETLYNFDAEVESNTIEVYVSRLRKKLGRDRIETQRGLGYRLVRR
ncbi:response regulator transcription factor [Cereibacter sphaeroides]|uniref:response regulator n=1 Tax=Rhodobacterales TaxID=204455 RepID=UPI000BBE72A6|nr:MULTISPECIES: response regulator transcription factor [Paracoccaceae]MCE6951432.1 response regulator transcription factor [Cereibacter sphaeroides]MCE6960757.1 response regulator transcription factor [Cereibacter sphaeroides]MCE6969977.1 response regulator transcription factor [Cereibacter sphaeroides]MCE6974365.1 response regulator transcription factor [Cereibacter sphaeroides]